MKQGRETTQEERIRIARDCIASGKNYGEMALKYKVSYHQARTWTHRFEERGDGRGWLGGPPRSPEERPNAAHRTGASVN